MKLRLQFGGWLLAVASCAGLSAPCYAQRPRFVAQHQQEKKQPPPPKQNPPKPNANRPPANQNRPADRPPVQNPNVRPNGNNPGNSRQRDERLAPRQQLGVGAPRPWVDKMRDMKPQDRERVMQNSPAFRSMPSEQQNRIREQFGQWDRKTPQQRSDQREREQAWRQMTPDQREHIKNDVLPAWRQLPQERRQAIQQRLGVLKNMPESARNQRLSDPNFTRGMSEEDKATLHDLSHLHVGGAPDPPPNE